MAVAGSKRRFKPKKDKPSPLRNIPVRTGGLKVGDTGLVDYHYGSGYAEMERREYERVKQFSGLIDCILQKGK
jgi:hypothetical protein